MRLPVESKSESDVDQKKPLVGSKSELDDEQKSTLLGYRNELDKEQKRPLTGSNSELDKEQVDTGTLYRSSSPFKFRFILNPSVCPGSDEQGRTCWKTRVN